MTNITAFNSKEVIQQQASQWISRIDRGLTIQEHEQLQIWADSGDSHRDILFNMAQIWDDMSVLNELKGLMSIERIDTTARQKRVSPRWAIAASIGFLMFTLMAWFMSNPALEHYDNSFNSTLSTAIGEQKPVTLEDGSIVYLNTNTEIKVAFSAQDRQIEIVRGEALFDVAHDTQRPFVVSAAGNTVTAVGTAFNVQLLDDDHFELLVTEGKVLLKNEQQSSINKQNSSQHPLNGNGTLLIAGQKTLVAQDLAQTTTLNLEQIQNDLAWRQGIVVFHGAPLATALTEISRYTPIQFNFADEKLKQKRVAGYFKAGDIDGLLAALSNNFDIKYQKIDDKTILLSSTI